MEIALQELNSRSGARAYREVLLNGPPRRARGKLSKRTARIRGASTNNDSRRTGQVLKILINTEYTDNTVSLEFADQNPEPVQRTALHNPPNSELLTPHCSASLIVSVWYDGVHHGYRGYGGGVNESRRAVKQRFSAHGTGTENTDQY